MKVQAPLGFGPSLFRRLSWLTTTASNGWQCQSTARETLHVLVAEGHLTSLDSSLLEQGHGRHGMYKYFQCFVKFFPL
jgi:hypothetical protein